MTADAVPRTQDAQTGAQHTHAAISHALSCTGGGGRGTFVSYVLWPTWPSTPTPLDAPAIPITVAGVLFDVPPAAIRAAVQRHPGQQERIDLAFHVAVADAAAAGRQDGGQAARETAAKCRQRRRRAAATSDRLFVTIAGLGAVLPPLERLRTHLSALYREPGERPGRTGSRSCRSAPARPMRAKTWSISAPIRNNFSPAARGRCRAVPGTCIHERALDGAEITLRFPRDWLGDWRNVAAGFDRLRRATASAE